MNKILGGYYLKARCVQESDIAQAPPYVREIWDWILKEANHSDTRICKRGQTIRTFRDIQEGLCWYAGWRKHTYSKDQCEKAMKWLRKATMIATKKTTRGMLITVLNYDKFQDPKNYEYDSESNTKATEVQQPTATINKNVKNDKNEKKYILSPEGDTEPFSFKKQIDKMLAEKDRRMNIIAYYWIVKEFKFPTRIAYETALKRELKAAGSIVGYENNQIKKTISWLKNNADFKWTLETVHKYIDEPLENLKMGGKIKTEDDEIEELKRKYA